MQMRLCGGTAALALAAVFASAGVADAHPHVFADARLDVVVNSDGTVKALKHAWIFDDVFSATVIIDFDKNGDNKMEPNEILAVEKTIHESLAEYGYFQLVTVNGVDVKMVPPPAIHASFKGQQMTVKFESVPAKPLKLAGTVDFGIYDPTFYTAIDFREDGDMRVDKLPANCSRTVIRPDPDTAIAQNQKTLTDAFFNDPTGTDFSKLVATKLELDCKKAEG
jgi:ABC-type uncharacterized transport system substrate-binding protein